MLHHHYAVLDAPSNLGLRQPAPGIVPGCSKLPGALRDHGIVARLGAEDAGCVTAPRYDLRQWKPGDGVFNAAALAHYTQKLAERIGLLIDRGRCPVVLGGDCSILLGAALALRRRGRYGLGFLDGHSDFRHPGNVPITQIGAAAGEDLALVTGRGQRDLTDLEGRMPYVRDEDVAVLGIRDADECLAELRELGVHVWEAGKVRSNGAPQTAKDALAHLEDRARDGFWIHVDADILDPEVMPAVDSPDPCGLGHNHLAALLSTLAASTRCIGIDIAVLDPDLDPTGALAGELTNTVVRALT
ncbi:arginase family protein [Pendulispora albinea]|uniref:Arginase family protein n=1 Tax=Pendulispora albinea TaxID=2741071 RepID=A0ABZ2LM25_9BACT